VLVLGSESEFGMSFNSATLYDPSTDEWEWARDMPLPRINHNATLLLDGKVLVTGGSGGLFRDVTSAETYDPSQDTWVQGARATNVAEGHTTTLLHGGQVLLVGGRDAGGAVSSVVAYESQARIFVWAGEPAGN
jgi:N-acetylneuraminic acid mutarotase